MPNPNLRLRHERELRGWSQADVAERIDGHDYYLSRWERGEVLPGPYYQQRLCELFGKTAEELGFLPSVRKEDPGFVTPADGVKTTNPFTYGNPVSEPARFFGRTLLVEQVFNRLRNAEFESSSLVGERRIGKTSLLKYIAYPSVRQHYGLDVKWYIFVYVDLQLVDASTTQVRFWQWLLPQMARSFSDPQIKQQLQAFSTTQVIDNFALEDLFDQIDAHHCYVVLLLDEFEHVMENANFDAAFFYGLRSLAIHHHLSLITSSRSELIDLCHSRVIRSSPFFNIFATMMLGLLTQEEATDLVTRSLSTTEVTFTAQEMELLFTLAGRHPYFLQAACSFLFDAYTKGFAAVERRTFLHQSLREEAAPHFAFFWHNCDDHEKKVLIALMLIEAERHNQKAWPVLSSLPDFSLSTNRTMQHLEHRSLVISVGKTFSLFNALFAEWIWSEITDTRRNQQSDEEWLHANKPVADLLKSAPEANRKELVEILSQMNAQYHMLLMHWLRKRGVLPVVSPCLKKLLADGWGPAV